MALLKTSISRALTINKGAMPVDFMTAVKTDLSADTYLFQNITDMIATGYSFLYNNIIVTDITAGRRVQLNIASGANPAVPSNWVQSYADNKRIYTKTDTGAPDTGFGLKDDWVFNIFDGNFYYKSTDSAWDVVSKIKVTNLVSNSITSSATSAVLFNAAPTTTLGIGGSATTITVGAATGIITINNPTVTLAGATSFNINGVAPTLASTSTGKLTLFNTAITSVDAFGACTSVNIGKSGSPVNLMGNGTVAGTLSITGNTTLNSNVTLVGSDTSSTEFFKIQNASLTDKFSVDSASGDTVIAGNLTVTQNIFSDGFAASRQTTCASTSGSDNWTVDFSLGNTFFKEILSAGGAKSITLSITQEPVVEGNAINLLKYAGGTFIISILNTIEDTITVNFSDSAMIGITGESIDLRVNEGFTYAGVIFAKADSTAAYMYGNVTSMSNMLL